MYAPLIPRVPVPQSSMFRRLLRNLPPEERHKVDFNAGLAWQASARPTGPPLQTAFPAALGAWQGRADSAPALLSAGDCVVHQGDQAGGGGGRQVGWPRCAAPRSRPSPRWAGLLHGAMYPWACGRSADVAITKAALLHVPAPAWAVPEPCPHMHMLQADRGGVPERCGAQAGKGPVAVLASCPRLRGVGGRGHDVNLVRGTPAHACTFQRTQTCCSPLLLPAPAGPQLRPRQPQAHLPAVHCIRGGELQRKPPNQHTTHRAGQPAALHIWRWLLRRACCLGAAQILCAMLLYKFCKQAAAKDGGTPGRLWPLSWCTAASRLLQAALGSLSLAASAAEAECADRRSREPLPV